MPGGYSQNSPTGHAKPAIPPHGPDAPAKPPALLRVKKPSYSLTVAGIAFVIELGFLSGRDKLVGHEVTSLIVY